MSRRRFLQSALSLPFLGGAGRAATRDVYAELGVRPFINAAGTFTALSASLVAPEVQDAMRAASRRFVSIVELQDAVGARIASLLGCEAAMVTSGAAGALTCGTAACITGADRSAILRIPDLAGLRSEVIVQRNHRNAYDHAVRACGVRMVEVETAEDVDRAVGEKTAMMLFFNDAVGRGRIGLEEFVRLGKKHRIPTFNDAAADVPPAANLSRYTAMGFDLVTFSGGKGLCGPQSAGLLLGRRDLIEAARLNTSPNSDSVARGMKVNKEEIVGMLVALERYLARDHAAEWREWERRAALIAAAATKAGATAEIFVPEVANHAPHVRIQSADASTAAQRLRAGEPRIEVSPASNDAELVIGVWMLQPGEAEVVARRLRGALTG